MRRIAMHGWKAPIGALMIAVLIVLGGLATWIQPVVAAPLRAQPLRPLVSIREVAKSVLPETSIASPALSSLSDYSPSDAGPVSALAWTGVDASHSLNVMLSQGGLKYGDKVTLRESSAARPSVLLVREGTANRVVLAWTGTDARHSLNVLYDVYGARKKITISDNTPSYMAPSLAFFNGQIWLAWTGTDASHSLNVRAMGPQGLTPGAKTVLSQQWSGFTSRDGPSLRVDMRDHLLLITWIFLALPPTIDLAQSSDGARWSASFSPPPPQTSIATPDAMALPASSLTAGIPSYYWAWTGTDSANSLNIAYTSTLHSWPAPVVTLRERGFGGPSLGYLDGSANGEGHQIALAWTGVDPAHHLNVALFSIQ
jgi:hypothetical protein